ncbi:Ribonuclease T2 precursor (RNase T2) [Entomophthora muscae]|uniref:Ribonuclease T2 (RNase T2) n=1 Tax=Entomophthora muscae TaxID=34485 RepID=A0ACC2SW18_9FUNG|nr:Ribonuclease T2 precursor (RNase T2) [Entomophthora muscae]
MSGLGIDTGLRANVALGTHLQRLKCPDTAVSCIDDEDKCCIPDKGWMTLALDWNIDRPIDKFTLHGFWPADCETGIFPPGGCASVRTKPSKDLPRFPSLKLDMEKHWLSNDGDDAWLWNHEWNKHGTCLSTIQKDCHLDVSNDHSPFRYFKASLDQYHQFDVYAELKKNNVVPRLKPYPQKEIVDALKRWAFSFQLQCIKGRLNQIFFLRLGKARDEFIDRTYTGCTTALETSSSSPRGSTSLPWRSKRPRKTRR